MAAQKVFLTFAKYFVLWCHSMSLMSAVSVRHADVVDAQLIVGYTAVNITMTKEWRGWRVWEII